MSDAPWFYTDRVELPPAADGTIETIRDFVDRLRVVDGENDMVVNDNRTILIRTVGDVIVTSTVITGEHLENGWHVFNFFAENSDVDSAQAVSVNDHEIGLFDSSHPEYKDVCHRHWIDRVPGRSDAIMAFTTEQLGRVGLVSGMSIEA